MTPFSCDTRLGKINTGKVYHRKIREIVKKQNFTPTGYPKYTYIHTYIHRYSSEILSTAIFSMTAVIKS